MFPSCVLPVANLKHQSNKMFLIRYAVSFIFCLTRLVYRVTPGYFCAQSVRKLTRGFGGLVEQVYAGQMPFLLPNQQHYSSTCWIQTSADDVSSVPMAESESLLSPDEDDIGRLELYTQSVTYIRSMALCPGLPGWAGTRTVKPIWILLKQETVSGSGISWAVCKSAPRSRQKTTPAPHHSVFYRPDTLPAAQPTATKHWRHYTQSVNHSN